MIHTERNTAMDDHRRPLPRVFSLERQRADSEPESDSSLTCCHGHQQPPLLLPPADYDDDVNDSNDDRQLLVGLSMRHLNSFNVDVKSIRLGFDLANPEQKYSNSETFKKNITPWSTMTKVSLSKTVRSKDSEW